VSAREEGVVAVALAVADGGEEVVGSVAAAELVLPGGRELEVVAGDSDVVVVVVEHEVGDGFSGEFAPAFEHDVKVHH